MMCSAFYYLNYLVQLYKLNEEGKQIRRAREYIKCAIRTHTHFKPHTLSRLRRRFFKKKYLFYNSQTSKKSGEIILNCKCWTFRALLWRKVVLALDLRNFKAERPCDSFDLFKLKWFDGDATSFRKCWTTTRLHRRTSLKAIWWRRSILQRLKLPFLTISINKDAFLSSKS